MYQTPSERDYTHPVRELAHLDQMGTAFACLLYSIWRAVDLVVQVDLTREYEHSPIVTADNTLSLLNKETGIG